MTTHSSAILEAIGMEDSLSALRQLFAERVGNDKVTVQDWEVYYWSNGLIESCTVTANQTNDSILTVGLLAYDVDGKTLYCSQLTRPTNSNNVLPTVSTGGFKVQIGGQVLGVVFGYLGGDKFFFEEVLTVKGMQK